MHVAASFFLLPGPKAFRKKTKTKYNKYLVCIRPKKECNSTDNAYSQYVALDNRCNTLHKIYCKKPRGLNNRSSSIHNNLGSLTFHDWLNFHTYPVCYELFRTSHVCEQQCHLQKLEISVKCHILGFIHSKPFYHNPGHQSPKYLQTNLTVLPLATNN